jgi:hypothetical protein
MFRRSVLGSVLIAVVVAASVLGQAPGGGYKTWPPKAQEVKVDDPTVMHSEFTALDGSSVYLAWRVITLQRAEQDGCQASPGTELLSSGLGTPAPFLVALGWAGTPSTFAVDWPTTLTFAS